jgi:hypothetical protein
VLELVDDGSFQIAFGIGGALLQAEELEDIGLLEQIGWLVDGVSFAGKPADALLVPAESEALVEAGIELAFEVAARPIFPAGFDLIEAALVGIVNAEKKDVVRPGQREPSGSASDIPPNWSDTV